MDISVSRAPRLKSKTAFDGKTEPSCLNACKKATSFGFAKPNTILKKVLVLDLDETLIHCKDEPFENVTSEVIMSSESKETRLYVSERPGLKSFIINMSKIFKLVLYTSAVKKYAHLILKLTGILPYFDEILHRADCELNSSGKIEKNLEILGADPTDIIFVDDSSVHVRNQPHNILLIKPYRGDRTDCELYFIEKFLSELVKEKDVRPVMEHFRRFACETTKSSIQRIATVERSFEIKSLAGLRAKHKSESDSDQRKTDLSDIDENSSDTDEKPGESEIEQKPSQMIFRRKSSLKALKPVSQDYLASPIRAAISTAGALSETTASPNTVSSEEERLQAEGSIMEKLPMMNPNPQRLSVKNCIVQA